MALQMRDQENIEKGIQQGMKQGRSEERIRLLSEALKSGVKAEKLAEMGEMSGASARAVGSAVGRNPISVIIPCHRVVGKDGTLRGYAGGIGRKLQLLMLEGVDVSRYIEREQRPDTRC